MTASASPTTDRRSDGEQLRAARELLAAGRFAQALALAEKVLKQGKDSTEREGGANKRENGGRRAETASDSAREWFYLKAVACRYLEQFDAALAAIDQSLALASERGRSHQEKGHTLQLMGRLLEAEDSYERAVSLNPALTASWRALLALLKLYEATPERQQRLHYAAAELARREALLPPLLAAESLFHDGELDRADALCRRFLTEHKTHADGLALLARINGEAGHLADAEFLFETLLELHPTLDGARYDYANLLLRMQKFAPAHEQTRRLLATQPGHPPYLALHANALAGIGDTQGAIRVYDQVLKRSPGQPQLLVMRGHAEKTEGRRDAAIRSYQRAYQLRGDYGDAYWSLANTKAYRFSDAEMETMRCALRRTGTQLEDRIHLAFALGKGLEDHQQFEQSFRCYELGNSLKQATVAHRPAYLAQRAEKQQQFFTRERFEQFAGAGCDAADPIFIVGLPRAGSTLLEQILASHSQIDGTMELPHIISLVQRLRRGARRGRLAAGYPEVLDVLEPGMLRRFGEQFLAQTQLYRDGAAYFIDKNPNNFFHIGLIKMILPRAKVIDARRHPLSCCFSGFKQLFGQGQEFSYGLKEIGNYYREYVHVMDHWDEVLPGFVHRVQHETLVDHFETEVRRLLDFCGVPFEAACLEFYKTERKVRTPSSEQVRRPIFRSSLEAWRPFDAWLDPLREALGPEVRERYDVAAPKGTGV